MLCFFRLLRLNRVRSTPTKKKRSYDCNKTARITNYHENDAGLSMGTG
jgi:hypothetical protein